MLAGSLLADELVIPEQVVPTSHPMDSSQTLLGLMALSRQSEAGDTEPLGGAVARKLMRSLMSALRNRDVATVQHTRRVAMLSVGMARYLGWEGDKLKRLEVAALLHDIGKIGVPDNILFKPGKLNPDEAELMGLHHNVCIDVLQASRVHPEVLEIIIQAHGQQHADVEEFQRLGGEIHQGARILAVADAYDSLSTQQVYRESKQHAEIVKILKESSGRTYDTNVVAALARWIDREGLPFDPDQPAGDASQRSGDGTNDSHEAASLNNIFAYLYMLENLYDGFYLLDSDLKCVVYNRGFERLLGRPAGDVLGQMWTSKLIGYADRMGQPLAEKACPINQVIAQGRATTSVLKVQRGDGRWLDVELQTVPLLDGAGRLQGAAEIYRDLSRSTRRPKEYRELKLAASRDALTNVANRGELETQLSIAVGEASRGDNPEPLSVIFLDVDHFKSVNDTFGHAAGDQVLIDLANLLQQETYNGELVARYGGEEFVIVCPAADLDQAHRKADQLRALLPKGNIGGLANRQVTASFGVAQLEPGDSLESLLRRADKALYTAKETGRNKTCSLTTESLHEVAAEEAGQNVSVAAPQDPFVYVNEFAACIAADMIVYKLGGFVDDQKAKLVKVSEKFAVIRLGNRGLFSTWGRRDDKQPVELHVEFGEERRGVKEAASRQVQVTATVKPLGWIRDAEVFCNRAKRVVKMLRSYFAAN